MPNVALFKQDGSQNGEITLNEEIFGIEPNETVVYDAIIMQRASLRQGTHAVKNRSAVRGGGRKPWRQKGTGRLVLAEEVEVFVGDRTLWRAGLERDPPLGIQPSRAMCGVGHPSRVGRPGCASAGCRLRAVHRQACVVGVRMPGWST